MENEENRGLIYKKASEDQLASSWPKFVLKFCFGARKGKERKGRTRKIKESKEKARKSGIKKLP